MCVYTDIAVPLFRCSTKRGVLYVYNREGVIIIFFTFSFGKIWKVENLFVSLQSILEERARYQEQRPIAQRKVIKNKPKITLTELQGLIIKV